MNLGGAKPGDVSMSTLAHPGRYAYYIGEHEEESPWESLAVEHGSRPTRAPSRSSPPTRRSVLYAQRSRTPEDLMPTIAASMAVISHHRMTHWGDTLLVLSPEHAKILGDAGWKKADVRRWLHERLQWPVRELIPGRDGGEGLPAHVLGSIAIRIARPRGSRSFARPSTSRRHGRRRHRRTVLRDRAGLDVLEGLESRLQEDRPMTDVSRSDRFGRRAPQDGVTPREPRRQGHHLARHLEGAGQSPAGPARRAAARAHGRRPIVRKEEADLRAPWRPTRSARRSSGPPTSSSRDSAD